MAEDSGRPDSLDLVRLRTLLGDCPVGAAILYRPGVASTHGWAHEEADRRPHGTLYLADVQTAGRGRGLRGWHSPFGLGLYWTVVLGCRDGQIPSARLPLLNLMAALEAALAIEEATGAHCLLKWPNDLLLDGRKVGGLLLECASRGGWVQHAVLSMGINVNNPPGSFPADIRDRSTSLAAATGGKHDREAIAASLARRVSDLWEALPAMAQAEALAAWQGRAAAAHGARIRFRRRNGSEVEGVTAGLSPEGLLLLRVGGGSEEPMDGEILEIYADRKEAS